MLADAIEADLRDAGYEVVDRTNESTVVWVDPDEDPMLKEPFLRHGNRG